MDHVLISRAPVSTFGGGSTAKISTFDCYFNFNSINLDLIVGVLVFSIYFSFMSISWTSFAAI